jgi:hypothetical protein
MPVVVLSQVPNTGPETPTFVGKLFQIRSEAEIKQAIDLFTSRRLPLQHFALVFPACFADELTSASRSSMAQPCTNRGLE